jgi:hypothetical protein
LGRPAQAVSIVPSIGLRSLLGTEWSITAQEQEESASQWRRLRSENAPFRIVTEAGPVSTSIDYFDPWLLAHATSDWQRIARVVHDVFGHNSEPYVQVYDLMLLARVVALVKEGKLLADGDPGDMLSCHIRLPG